MCIAFPCVHFCFIRMPTLAGGKTSPWPEILAWKKADREGFSANEKTERQSMVLGDLLFRGQSWSPVT